MKPFLLSLIFLLSLQTFAQKVNDYAYVIVPEKYDAMKRVDQYQVNSLTKFLLNKYGFEAYLAGDEKPFAMADAACDVLYADLVNESNFIHTRLALVLKDCEGAIIYKTTQGRSKNKDFKAGYNEALRNAFEDVKELKYAYTGNAKTTVKKPTEKPVQQTKVVVVKEPAKAAKRSVTVEKIKTAPVEKVVELAAPKEVIKDVVSSIDSSASAVFMSADGFYKAVRLDNTVTFYEGAKNIGNAAILQEDGFPITTSEFEGEGFFKEGRLVIERKIKGVAGVVQMIFTKE